jgi:4-amino-4-deoxy-L-arabinose transferase-like glycosyltransferase
MKRIYSFIFIFIFLIGSFLRLYKLDQIPPSLNWDEVAASYNAYTIKNWAKDEWGKTLPLVFASFRDDKRPVHIYITSMVFNFLGVSDFSARFSSALLGILLIPLFFFLGKLYFGSDLAGLFSAFAIAFSSYDIHYSRGLWEAHFALFFFVLGLVLFKASLSKKGREVLLPFSYFSFGVSLLSYHSALIVVPPLVLLLTFVFIRDLFKLFRWFAIGFFVFLVFISVLFFEPRLLGIARINQNKLSSEVVAKTYLFQKTGSGLLGQLEYRLSGYKDYFSYNYLFKEGSVSPRASMGYGGLFSKVVFSLALLGFILLFSSRKFSILLIFILWVVLAPLPAVFAGGEANATRAIFMLGPIEFLSGYGFFRLIDLFSSKYFKGLILISVFVLFFWELFPQIYSYFKNYSEKAIEWQYGMKDIVYFLKNNPKYNQVYVDNIRQQPYVFFLWYEKVPLPEFLRTVKYDRTTASSFNTVFSFDRYQFGGWDWIESTPLDGVIYVIEPYKYTGLRRREDFSVLKLVKYPNGSDAFYIVSSY